MDLTGQKYGILTVIEKSEKRVTPKGRNVYMWRCLCDCGNETIVSTSALRNGQTKSCGCLQKERVYESLFTDLSGNRYGRLLAIKPIRKNNGIYWICRCDCGNTTEVLPQHLKRGLIRSCGCLRRDVSSKAKKHGWSGTRIYKEWKGIKDRCLNPKNTAYKNYGGRGIKICDEWLGEEGPENFINWALSNGYDDTLTIERKDVDGNYCPENCCWIPLGEQALNTRNNVYLEYNGESKPISQWAKEYGINYQVFHNRVRNLGWSMEKALNEPVRRY